MRKKVKVVMTPTNSVNQIDQGDLFINDTREHSWGKLEALTCERVTVNGHAWNGSGIRTNINHLCFVSDEEIKVGDWCVHLSRGYVFKVYNFGESNGSVTLIPSENNLPEDLEFLLVDCKKVVATTDKSLVYLTNNGRVAYNLPQIPESFIKHYVNVGGINEIEIEYLEDFIDAYTEDRMRRFYGKPKVKVDSNNCVFTHPIKDSWSRQEVIGILKEYRNCIMPVTQKEIDYLDKWINKNL